MYECYNIRSFLRLLLLDIIIFSICIVFFFIMKFLVFPETADYVGNSTVSTTVSHNSEQEYQIP